MSLFTDGLNLSDEEARRLENDVRAKVTYKEQLTSEYYANIRRLWFRRFFFEGDGLRTFTPYLYEVMGEESKPENEREKSKWVLDKFQAEARKEGLPTNVYFNTFAWMVACSQRPDGRGFVGDSSRMVANFRRCWINDNFDPDNYTDTYFKELLLRDSSYEAFSSLIEEAKTPDAANTDRYDAAAKLRRAFNNSSGTITCDPVWKLCCNGNESAKIILALENWLWPNDLNADRKVTIGSKTKPVNRAGVFFTIDEIVNGSPSNSSAKFSVLAQCGGQRGSISCDKTPNSILAELASGSRALIFEDDGDSSIRWYPLVDLETHSVASRYVWVCINDSESQSLFPPDGYQIRKPLAGGRGFAYRIELADIDETEREYKTQEGVILFKYKRERGRYTVARHGFTDDVRIENDRWRVFVGDKCSFTSARGKAEWRRMPDSQHDGITIQDAICTIRPRNPEVLEEYEIRFLRSKETILHIPESVISNIRNAIYRGKGWSFEPENTGAKSVIRRAVDGGISGTLRYDFRGEQRQLTIFVKVPLTKPTFWLERGALGYEDMEPYDCLLHGRTFNSWGDIDNYWLCSKADASSSDGVLRLEARLQDGSTREILLDTNEGVSGYGRKDINGLLEDITRNFAEGNDEIHCGEELLFRIKCVPDRLQLFRNQQGIWRIFAPSNCRDDALVLFSERILCDPCDAIVCPQSDFPNPDGDNSLPMFCENWTGKPVYATVIQQLPGHPWLPELACHAGEIVCVRDGDALADDDLSNASFALSHLATGTMFMRCFAATREALRRQEVTRNLAQVPVLGNVWTTFAGRNDTDIGDILVFLLENGFNFLAVPRWMDSAFERALQNGCPDWTGRSPYQWNRDGRLRWLPRTVNVARFFLDNGDARNENYERGDGWLPIAIFEHLYRYQNKQRFSQNKQRFSWERCGLREVTCVHANFTKPIQVVNSRFEQVSFMVDLWRNGRLTDQVKVARSLFGLNSTDFNENLFQVNDKEFLVQLLQKTRSKYDIPGACLLVQRAFLDDEANSVETLDLDCSVIGMTAAVSRLAAHGYLELPPDENERICGLVKRALDDKVRNRGADSGDETGGWYWRWLMRDAVAIDWAIRLR